MNTPRFTVIILGFLLQIFSNRSVLLSQYIINKMCLGWLGKEGNCGQKISQARQMDENGLFSRVMGRILLKIWLFVNNIFQSREKKILSPWLVTSIFISLHCAFHCSYKDCQLIMEMNQRNMSFNKFPVPEGIHRYKANYGKYQG